MLAYHGVAFRDHSACTSLLNAAHPSGKLARWAMVIQELDIEIQHRPCKANSNADALSYNPVPLQTSGEEAAVWFPKPITRDCRTSTKRPNYLDKGTLPGDER